MKEAVVIGAGISGLASALRLKRKGYGVTVIESGETYGGKMGVIESGGYRWDTGPSLFTMPHLVEELFELFDLNADNYFDYIKKDKVCNYFWPNGKRFTVHADISTFIREASSAFLTDEEKIRAYLKNSKTKYDLTADIFLEKSLHRLKTFLNFDTLKSLLQSYKLDISSTLDQVNKKYFEDPHLIQLFNRYATYNGSSPYKTPGIMSLIPHLEMHYGAFLPRGGMRAIPESLYNLGTQTGINYRFNETVTKILTKKGKATGVSTDKGLYEADLVVTNMDVYYTFKKLLPEIKSPLKTLNLERSSSALVFYWGINGNFSELDLHNIFFSSDYQSEFKYIFEKNQPYTDPTIYINITSKDEPNDAPKGCENWFVMVNVPANVGQDWGKIKREMRQIIIEKLNNYLDTDLNTLITYEETLDPVLIDSKTNSFQGALYGTSSNTQFSAFLRHPNFSRRVKNLYFCGGSVHPGGGIPLCLQSAKIACNAIPDA